MNYELTSQSRLIRCGLAAAAIAMTLALGSGIDGLARHYPAQAAELAQKSVLIAKR